MSLSDQPPDFLTAVLQQSAGAHDDGSSENGFPRITLTFAQSTDAKIAGKDGKQLILSCKESMIMTHWMRTMHDAILVGIGTVINDDPQLNTRHLPAGTQGRLPQPVIIDSRLRLPIGCKLLRNFQEGRGLQPWIICSSSQDSELGLKEGQKSTRKRTLEDAGAKILEVPTENGRLSISAILETLYRLGISSLMVEGGATVMESFLSQRLVYYGSGRNTLIMTIAPTIVGPDGIGYGELQPLEPIRTELVGQDTVIVFRL